MPTHDATFEVFLEKHGASTYLCHACFSPLVFCHYSPDMLDQIIAKSSEVLFQKVEKLLFTDYCSLITVHGLLFTDHCSQITVTVHDTVHFEILPI